MPTINSLRPQTKPHHGKSCQLKRSVTLDDGEAFDVALAKTVVQLEDTDTEIIVANIELQF
jgi:hypothetical protein